MDRRRFLKSVGLQAGGLSFGRGLLGGAGIGLGSGCSADTEESAPGSGLVGLPGGRAATGTLELFLLGGISPWETFYTVPEFGDPARGGPHAGTQWHTFQNDPADLNIKDAFARCDGGDRAMFEPFGLDSAGTPVNLGPFVYPLRDRPDILARMRIWVMRHDLGPHEAAVPKAMTGHARGAPRLASLGAHVQARFRLENPGLAIPSAYTVYQKTTNTTDNTDTAQAPGLYGMSARPLAIRLGQERSLAEQLRREGARGGAPQVDAVVDHFMNRFRRRYSTADARLITSPGFEELLFARNVLAHAGDVAGQLPPGDLSSPLVSFGYANDKYDQTATSLDLATWLLTRAPQRAQYVNVLDNGLWHDTGGQGFDTHIEHVQRSSTNLVHSLRQLAWRINQPGENDPGKLDLDQHMVLVTSEFGRTPFRQVDGDGNVTTPETPGTDHWPWGYCVIGFGGPIDADRRGIVGAIGEDAYATSFITPSEHRAAVMMAMGMYPFTPEGFVVGDIREGSTEPDAARWLLEHVLGYGS